MLVGIRHNLLLMRYLNLFFLVLVVVSCQNLKKEETFIKAKFIPSRIDSLKSNFEVENLIRSCDTNYKKFELKTYDQFDRDCPRDSLTKLLAKKLKVSSSFFKADFDNNGLTDLLVIGDNKKCYYGFENKSCDFSSFVVMNFKRGKYKISNIERATFNHSFVPKVENINDKVILAIYNPRSEFRGHVYEKERIDTLIYKFDTFIELEKNQEKTNIENIEYSTSPCFGTCPVYKLTVDNKKNGIFFAEKYNFSDDYKDKDEGFFKGKVDDKKYKELISILNYIDFSKLKDEYHVTATCQSSCVLKITYNNGKVKMIGDYGQVGTYGLKLLYQKLSDLRFNQKWTKNNK